MSKKTLNIAGATITLGKPPGGDGVRVLVDIPEDRARLLIQNAEGFRKKLRMIPGIAPITDAMLQLEMALMELIAQRND